MRVGITDGAFGDLVFKQIENIGLTPISINNSSDLETIKSIIFTGGEDISPEIYGEANTYSFTNSRRDDLELSLLEKALELGIQVIGICRGHQLINAFLGGKLVQDLGIGEFKFHRDRHPLTIKGGIVENLFKDDIVNSKHHQGVISPGKDLVVTSTHKGVIESTESVDGKIISVQCHPETFSTEFFRRCLYVYN